MSMKEEAMRKSGLLVAAMLNAMNEAANEQEFTLYRNLLRKYIGWTEGDDLSLLLKDAFTGVAVDRKPQDGRV
jgi:hypothetical protein